MIVNSVTYSFPPERAEEAAALLRELGAASRREPGCRAFDAYRSIDDPRVFVLHERYDDRAALDAHFETDHFKRLAAGGIRTFFETRVGHLCAPL